MWVKVDDRFPDHPKFAAAARAADFTTGPARIAGVWLAGLCYANRHRTQGELLAPIVRSWLRLDQQVETIAQALTTAGLWERGPDGYRIHDYACYQPPSFPQAICTDREFSTGPAVCSSTYSSTKIPDPDPDPANLRTRFPVVEKSPVENRNRLRALVWAETAAAERSGAIVVPTIAAAVRRLAFTHALEIDPHWLAYEIEIEIRRARRPPAGVFEGG